jgi:hypothetical protein
MCFLHRLGNKELYAALLNSPTQQIILNGSVLSIPYPRLPSIQLDRIVRPDIISRLKTTTIELSMASVTGAIAKDPEGERQILLTSGLIDFVEFAVGLAFLANEMEEGRFELEDQHGDDHSSFTPALMCLIGYFFYDVPFPDLSPIYSDKTSVIARSMCENAIVAFLCHELGHFELNHFSPGGNSSETLSHAMLLPEDIDASKTKELEADAFMREAFLKPGAIDAALVMVLHLVAVLDQIDNAEARTHPFLLNRIDHLIPKHESKQSESNAAESAAEQGADRQLIDYAQGLCDDDMPGNLAHGYDRSVFQDFRDEFQEALISQYSIGGDAPDE